MVRTTHSLCRLFTALLVACIPATACKQSPSPELVPSVPVAPLQDISLPDLALSPPPLELTKTGLKRSDLPPVGTYLLPQKVVEVKPPDFPRDTPGVRRYELQATLEEVMEFYKKRGYRVTRNPRGATVQPRDRDGLLHILPGQGRKLKLLFVTESTSSQKGESPFLDDPKAQPHPDLH
jgi:hypothetical protein